LWDQALQLLPQIFAFLTAGRSCAIAVVNDTDSTLTISGQTLDHGGFAPGALPPNTIGPRSIGTFGAQSGDDSVGTGAEGHLTYASDAGFTFSLHWDNPFVGGNSSDASVDNVDAFSTNAENSVGNQNATYRFIVSQVAVPVN
jgi:hypothetical protein